MIHILYLAAGHSRRYGSNKLLEMYTGKPLYRHGLSSIRRAIDDRNDCTLRVVTCWKPILQQLEAEGIECVQCPDSHLGISRSIRAGICACTPIDPDDYFCFAVADQPYLQTATFSRLLDAVRQTPLTACLHNGENSGNPVIFSAALKEELLSLEGDRGGKTVMLRHPERHIDVPCNSQELADIDTK